MSSIQVSAAASSGGGSQLPIPVIGDYYQFMRRNIYYMFATSRPIAASPLHSFDGHVSAHITAVYRNFLIIEL